jgi:hypothetical protein
MKKYETFYLLVIVGFILFLLFFFNVGNITGLFMGKFNVIVDEGIKVRYWTFNGSTTSFLYMSDLELESIENLTIEKTRFGKVVFLEEVNLTIDVVNNVVDLDSNVVISSNFIYISTDKLTSLSKPAVIYLYDLSFNNPQILRNGQICPDNYCKKIGYINGILIFSVVNFSNYSARETPLPTVDTPSGGGAGGAGGGGGGPLPAREKTLSVNKNSIAVVLEPGENKREQIEIFNMRDVPLQIRIESNLDSNLLSISNRNFTLNPGEKKIINLDFISSRNDIPGTIYIGKISIKSENDERDIDVVVHIGKVTSLFGLNSSLLKKSFGVGDIVRLNIEIIGVELKEFDVRLIYSIRDVNFNIVWIREEILHIKDYLKLERDVRIPKNLSSGDYIMHTEAVYNGVSSSNTIFFDVRDERGGGISDSVYIILGVILGILVLIIIGVAFRKIIYFISVLRLKKSFKK